MNIDLLIRHLTKETSREEEDTIVQWCTEDASHQKELDNLKLIWNLTGEDFDQTENNASLSLKKLKEKAALRLKPAIKLPLREHAWNYWLRIAAILVGIPLIAWFFVIQLKTHHELIAKTTGSTATTLLPDGSVVFLNRNSALKYPEVFEGQTRAVRLDKGEAFFKIKHNQKKPFVIQVNDIRIQVVGTSFNVKMSNGKTEIIVETGKVKVNRKDQEIFLSPAESTVIQTSDSHLIKEKYTDQLYTYYRNKEFVANGTPLWKLALVLNEAYDVQINIQGDELKNLPLNTTFKEQPLNDILEVIAKTFNISVQKNGTKIILKR